MVLFRGRSTYGVLFTAIDLGRGGWSYCTCVTDVHMKALMTDSGMQLMLMNLEASV